MCYGVAFTSEAGGFYSRSSGGERRMPGDAWRAAVALGHATLHCAASMGMLTGALHRGRRVINGGDGAAARQLWH